jgi:hypothetical protein
LSHADLQTDILSFKMAAVSLWKLLTGWKKSRWLLLPWKPRYQNNGVRWRPLLLYNGNSSYVTPTPVGWRIAILHFFFTIILPHIFVRSISRKCLNQTLWNVVGISYAMWSCAFRGLIFSKWLLLPHYSPVCVLIY